MAVNDPMLRYATDEFEANGTTTDWEISFVGGYIAPEHVFAISVVIDPETELASDTQAHDVEIIGSDDDSATARVSPAVAAGRRLYIYRSTPVNAMLVDYENKSLISKGNLNLANDQLLKIIQEMFDNLNITSLSVNQQIGTVIDLSKIINEVYQEVLQLLAAGGIVSVAPRVWSGVWEGDEEEDDSWLIPGADVSGAGFYDTYVNGEGLQPDVDYEIILDDDPAESRIRFLNVPAPGSTWFTVLRGYAKPYTGPTPITETGLRVPIYEATGTVFYADKAIEYGQVRCTNVAGCEVTVREIPAVGPSESKLGTGSFFSFTQKGTGAVELLEDDGVTFEVPAGCLPRTRGLNCTITATCQFGDGNLWLLSGDLEKA